MVTRHRQRKRPVPALPPRFHAERPARRTQCICTSAAANTSLPVMTLPVCAPSCRARCCCSSADSLVQRVWQRERRYAAVFLQGEGRCRPETRAAGTAVDLLLISREGGEGGRPDVFIAAQWSRSAPLGG